MKTYKIASIQGDGIGKEVVPAAHKVLKKISEQHQFKLVVDEFDFSSCDYYEKHGKMLPDDWKEKIEKHDAIFFWCRWYARAIPRSHNFMGFIIKI